MNYNELESKTLDIAYALTRSGVRENATVCLLLSSADYSDTIGELAIRSREGVLSDITATDVTFSCKLLNGIHVYLVLEPQRPVTKEHYAMLFDDIDLTGFRD